MNTTNEMHYNFIKIFFTLFLLQGLSAEVLLALLDVTTFKENNLEESTIASNSVESTILINAIEEILTMTYLPQECSGEDCTDQPAKDCKCNCLDVSLKELCNQVNNPESSNESTSQADIITTEESTINGEFDVKETTTNSLGNDISSETSTQENIESSEENILPTFNCTGIGYFPHPIDCHRYYNCNKTDDVIDSLKASEQLCPIGLAFNTEFSNCMRDLSPCDLEHGGFECNQAGTFPDPNNDTNLYYRCVPHLDGRVNSYHKYIVRCGSGRIYMPQLGKCFVDLNSIGKYLPFGYNPLEMDDEQLVKLELKQWKIKEKVKLKEEKNKKKYEQKLKKELAKQQAKEAKEKAKEEKKREKELGILEVDDSDE